MVGKYNRRRSILVVVFVLNTTPGNPRSLSLFSFKHNKQSSPAWHLETSNKYFTIFHTCRAKRSTANVKAVCRCQCLLEFLSDPCRSCECCAPAEPGWMRMCSVETQLRELPLLNLLWKTYTKQKLSRCSAPDVIDCAVVLIFIGCWGEINPDQLLTHWLLHRFAPSQQQEKKNPMSSPERLRHLSAFLQKFLTIPTFHT